LRFQSAISRLLANWITLLGSALASVAGLATSVLLVIGFLSPRANPYLTVGLIIELLAVFLTGVVLIPIGLYVDRRRPQSADPLQATFRAALGDRSARRRLFLFTGSFVSLIAAFAFIGHRTVSSMDSAAFCGSCHAVMQPEVDAWRHSPHSNVSCATCHIGTGAAGFVKAKWNGVRQLYEYVTSTYERPTFESAGHMLPARETCEQCHAPDRFFPDRIKVFPHYGLDKDNTPKFNALLLRIGGLNPATRRYEGIHSHADPDKQVEFEYLDARRTEIGKIAVLAGGKVKAVYQRTGAARKSLGVRTMDCVDCHNRATHIFAEGPAKAVDRALYAGALDPKLPFIAQVAGEVLAGTDVPREQAPAHFQAALAAAYQNEHPEVQVDPAALTNSGKTLSRIYLDSIYPADRLGWNQHPSNIGHRAQGLKDPGCFRCHNSEHEATLADGRKKKLGQDCDSCHTGLAFDQDPGKFDDTLAALVPPGK